MPFAQATRYAPQTREIHQGLSEASDEALDKRIKQTIQEQAQKAEEIHYIRSLCHIATIFAVEFAEGRQAIEVICPKDEARRLRSLHLLPGNVDRISLYPMTPEAYQDFAMRMREAGKGVGEYIAYSWNHGAWEAREVS